MHKVCKRVTVEAQLQHFVQFNEAQEKSLDAISENIHLMVLISPTLCDNATAETDIS